MTPCTPGRRSLCPTDDLPTPAENLAASRIDTMQAWLKSLNRRDRRVAEFLAAGQNDHGGYAAHKFKVSAGRISR